MPKREDYIEKIVTMLGEPELDIWPKLQVGGELIPIPPFELIRDGLLTLRFHDPYQRVENLIRDLVSRGEPVVFYLEKGPASSGSNDRRRDKGIYWYILDNLDESQLQGSQEYFWVSYESGQERATSMMPQQIGYELPDEYDYRQYILPEVRRALREFRGMPTARFYCQITRLSEAGEALGTPLAYYDIGPHVMVEESGRALQVRLEFHQPARGGYDRFFLSELEQALDALERPYPSGKPRVRLDVGLVPANGQSGGMIDLGAAVRMRLRPLMQLTDYRDIEDEEEIDPAVRALCDSRELSLRIPRKSLRLLPRPVLPPIQWDDI